MLSLYQGTPAPTICSFFLLSPSLPHPNPLHHVFLISWFSAQRFPEEEPPTAQDGWWQKTLRALKTLLLFSIILGVSLLLWGYVFQGCGPCKRDPRSPHSPLPIHHPSSRDPPRILTPGGPGFPASCPVNPSPAHQSDDLLLIRVSVPFPNQTFLCLVPWGESSSLPLSQL